jgi:hypothetical protein
MNRKFVGAAMIVIWISFGGASGFGHHSVAGNFDQSKSTEVKGKIKELAFRNPHSLITLEVDKPEGGVTEFFIEWSDKNALVRRSVPFDKIRVGDVVTVTVSPSRRLPNLGYFRTAILADGTVLRDCGFAAFRDGIAKGKTGC